MLHKVSKYCRMSFVPQELVSPCIQITGRTSAAPTPVTCQPNTGSAALQCECVSFMNSSHFKGIHCIFTCSKPMEFLIFFCIHFWNNYFKNIEIYLATNFLCGVLQILRFNLVLSYLYQKQWNSVSQYNVLYNHSSDRVFNFFFTVMAVWVLVLPRFL